MEQKKIIHNNFPNLERQKNCRFKENEFLNKLNTKRAIRQEGKKTTVVLIANTHWHEHYFVLLVIKKRQILTAVRYHYTRPKQLLFIADKTVTKAP